MAVLRPTRMELLARRRQLSLAEQGQQLLEDKRAALFRELLLMADVAVVERAELDAAIASAAQALDEAKALDGPETVASAALAAAAEGIPFQVTVDGAMVVGVPVPRITLASGARGLLDRGYRLALTSARVDRVSEHFQDVLGCLVHVAETEARVRRVGEEIRQTSRRVNALRQVIIPQLHREISAIATLLEEREREDHFRLKRLKGTAWKAVPP